MRTAYTRPAAALAVSLLLFPAVVAAKERRGATIVVTRLDGGRVAGELVAVKPDALLLLNAEGRDESVALAGIKSVRLVRKSRALPLAIGGFLAGAGEAVWATQRDAEDRSTKVTLFWVGVLGAGQALLGGAIGLGLGADAVLPFEGEPEAAVRDHLQELKARAREGRLRIEMEAAPAASPAWPAPGPGPGPAARPPKFRFSLAVGYRVGHQAPDLGTAQGSWQALGDVPPEEAGPFPAPFQGTGPRFWQGGLESPWRFGPVGAAYEWTRHWLVEAEWLRAKGRSDLASTRITFLSAADGTTYGADLPGPPYPCYGVAFDAFLAGLAYRIIVPDRLDRISLEIGAAAGPGWFRITPNPGLVPAVRKAVPAFRGRLAFDFYFLPSLSLGIFADYRYARAAVPAVSAVGRVAFYDVNDAYPYDTVPSFRDVLLVVPGLAVELNGAAIGARITLRI